MDPVGNLPVLDQAIVDLFVWKIRFGWLIRANEIDAILLVLLCVPFLVNLLESLKLFVRPRDDFVKLLVSVDLFNCLVFIIFVNGMYFTSSIHNQVFKLLLAILITLLLAKASCLNNQLIKVLLLLCLTQDALLDP